MFQMGYWESESTKTFKATCVASTVSDRCSMGPAGRRKRVEEGADIEL